MSRLEEAASARTAVSLLRSEYLDLLLLAGRLQRGSDGPQDPLGQDAVAVRRWVMTRLNEARRALDVSRFAGAPPVVIDAEIAIVAFLDSAATRLFGLRVWKSLREELHRDYREHLAEDGRQAGQGSSSVIDLGKFVYDRFESLRLHPDRFAAEPTELLEVYDRCLRLGYDATYAEPTHLADFWSKLREELRTRAQSALNPAAPAGARPSATPELALSPDLSPVESMPGRLPPLSPMSILVIGALLVLVTGTTLLGIVRHDEHALQKTVAELTTRLTLQARKSPGQVCTRPDGLLDSTPLAQHEEAPQ